MSIYSNLRDLHHYNRTYVFLPPKCSSLSQRNTYLELPVRLRSISLCDRSSRLVVRRCISNKFANPINRNESPESTPILSQKPEKKTTSSILDVLKNANSILPQIVFISTILAFIRPSSFKWFTSRYYAPALGFLMFAVGLNLREKDFIEAFKRPSPIFAGYVGQYVLKPFLGYLFGTLAVTLFRLPTSLSDGIMLTSCVNGAQLSNYATFLTDPTMTPLSIVMTSLSTASAVFVTPFLSLVLLGKRLNVDVHGMVSNILHIVVSPVVASLLLNRFFPQISNAIRPFLPPISLFVNFFCVGAPLAINMMTLFAGMQSSLLALALANKFFQDPLVGIPPAISVVVMSLMSFSLVKIWAKKENRVHT